MVLLKIKFNVTITPKCHIVLDNLEQVIDKKGKAVGQDSEQVLETCHQKFYKIYQFYKVKDVQKQRRGTQMLRCLHHFNSFNV